MPTLQAWGHIQVLHEGKQGQAQPFLPSCAPDSSFATSLDCGATLQVGLLVCQPDCRSAIQAEATTADSLCDSQVVSGGAMAR